MVQPNYDPKWKEYATNPIAPAPGYGGISVEKAFKGIDDNAKKTKKSFAEMNPLADQMNKSFQGMQSRVSVVQRIVGSIMDSFSIGLVKVQKDFVGALKKGLVEGDIPGMIQALIDIRYQFLDLGGLDLPFIEAFKPLNEIFTIIGKYAAAYVATSDSFQSFIASLGTAEGQSKLREMGEKLGEMIVNLVDLDWDKAIDFAGKILGIIEGFIRMATDWNRYWSNRPGSMGYSPSTTGPVTNPQNQTEALAYILQHTNLFSPQQVAWAQQQWAQLEPAVEQRQQKSININMSGVIRDSQVRTVIKSLRREAANWRV